MAGVYHAEGREQILLAAQGINLQLLPLPQLGNELIAEAHDFGFLQHLHAAYIGGELLLHGHDLADGLDEVRGDLSHGVDTVNGYLPAQQLRYGEDGVVPELLQVFQDLLGLHVGELGHVEVAHADFQRTDGLQEAFLQGSADAHDLAGGLHLGAQGVFRGGKLVEGEPGELGDYVVQAGLESGGGVGDLDILQSHAHGDLGGDPGNGVAGGLGGQGGGAGNSGVDLDEVIFGRVGVQSELHVAAAFDFQLPNDLDGGVIEHSQIMVRKGHDGGHYERVSGVDTYGIDVLHAADGDGVVVGVPHDLKLDFLVALDGLLNQHLMDGGEVEGVETDLFQLFFIVGEAAAGAAQGEGGTEHHRVADVLGRGLGFLQIVGDLRGDDGLTDGLAQLLEKLPVLGPLDGRGGGAQQLYVALLQHALLFQLHSQIQAGLAADAGNDGIGPLVADDLGDVFQGQGLHIDLVGNGGVGHDGGGVRVAQHHLVALFFQGQAGLGAGVVKLSRLPDDDGAGADDQNFFDVRSLCHFFILLQNNLRLPLGEGVCHFV